MSLVEVEETTDLSVVSKVDGEVSRTGFVGDIDEKTGAVILEVADKMGGTAEDGLDRGEYFIDIKDKEGVPKIRVTEVTLDDMGNKQWWAKWFHAMEEADPEVKGALLDILNANGDAEERGTEKSWIGFVSDKEIMRGMESGGVYVNKETGESMQVTVLPEEEEDGIRKITVEVRTVNGTGFSETIQSPKKKSIREAIARAGKFYDTGCIIVFLGTVVAGLIVGATVIAGSMGIDYYYTSVFERFLGG